MIMFWNRREVYIGFSMKKFNEIRDILLANNIKYDYRVINHNGENSRARFGSYGMNSKYEYEYYLYVHKSDYDYAYAKINGHC